jgi:hypothetical protein
MLNNNHKNKDCEHGEALVAYLYGEANAKENAAFEAHLASCRACAGELEAFSGARLAIGDWKSKDFDRLQTPPIEIPYETAAQTNEVTGVKDSWLPAVIRDLLSLSPRGWSLAAASFAIIAIAAGIAFFALNSPQTRDDLAEKNKNSRLAVVPTVEKSPEPANANAIQNNQPEREVRTPDGQKTPPPEVAVKPESENKRVVKVSNNQKPAPKVENTPTPKNIDAKRNNKNNTQTAPRVIPDEDEDDSLRLAELFEEIDTKE